MVFICSVEANYGTSFSSLILQKLSGKNLKDGVGGENQYISNFLDGFANNFVST